MKINEPLLEGVFLRRLNRFAVEVIVHGVVERCYFPNPSRLEELLKPQAHLLLVDRHRRVGVTRFDVLGIYDGARPVSIDTRVPNRLFAEAVQNRILQEFRDYRVLKQEYRWGRSRFDFLLANSKPALVEVKSCSLVVQGAALFPDVPTERGVRHLWELARALRAGYDCYLVWIIQRGDARYLRPYYEVDPTFAETLRITVRRGVTPLAYRAQLKQRRIEIQAKVPVHVL